MPNKEILSLRVMGRDISIACPAEEKNNLKKAAKVLNEEISSVPDKSNALILAALNLAYTQIESSGELTQADEEILESLISKIENAIV